MGQLRKTTARGYGYAHRALRQHWLAIVRAGQATCARCGQPIDPHGAWDLGHTEDRTGYTGPEHVLCNRGAGGRKARANAARPANNTTPASRDW